MSTQLIKIGGRKTMETLSCTEDLSASIVREFLSRKKCTATLQMLDQELPRTSGSINNRLKLAQSLNIEGWMRANKHSNDPLRTMLEVIIRNISAVQNSPNGLTCFPVSNQTEQHVEDEGLDNSLNKQSALKTVQSVPLESVTPLDIEELDDCNVDMNDSVPKAARMDLSRPFSDDLPTSLWGNKLVESKKELERSKTVVGSVGSKKPATKPKATSLFEMLSASPEKAISSIKLEQEVTEPISNFPWDMPRSKKPSKQSEKKEPHPKSLNNLDISTITISENTVEDTEVYSWKNVELVEKMRKLLLGSTKGIYPPEWVNQSFSFCDCLDGRPQSLRFGIVQKKGGPCGVLASVQATVLKHLLFCKSNFVPQLAMLNASSIERNKALVMAISEIIWRAGNDSSAYLVVTKLGCDFSPSATYRPDNFSETITIIQYGSQEKLKLGVQENIKSYLQGKGACLMLLYSAILSRGLNNVRSDMDEPNGKLMGAHNYCTQEMVNLLLTGRATSNAFDNAVRLDKATILKGIKSRCDVGLLSLFEHYDSCKVGEFYKTPKYPIWVVCSESHFTVLFCLNTNVVNASSDLESFDLEYYDGLANQDEFIKLTVVPSSKELNKNINEDLTPPLEHCIRTKWPRAQIDWNETEPIL